MEKIRPCKIYIFQSYIIWSLTAYRNFYGASYGTLLGQYIANMFPERVGRMYLAAVLEGTVWSRECVNLASVDGRLK
jgi:pimeloyl-ACP methyl ester carboxylesterase